MPSSNKEELNKNKNLEGVETEKSTTPLEIKEKIIAESVKEEDKTSGDLIHKMRNKIAQSKNAMVLESHDWEALCKMFQVLKIRSTDEDECDLDDVTLNLLQNIVNTLGINLKFTDDGLCEVIDFSEYEGELVEQKIVPPLDVELTDDVRADLLVFMNDFDTEISGSVKRINPKLFNKINSLSEDKLNTVSRIDNCISLLVNVQYLDIDMSTEMRNNLKTLIEQLNTTVRKFNENKNTFYKKFNKVIHKEDILMAGFRKTEKKKVARSGIRKQLKRAGEVLKGRALSGASDDDEDKPKKSKAALRKEILKKKKQKKSEDSDDEKKKKKKKVPKKKKSYDEDDEDDKKKKNKKGKDKKKNKKDKGDDEGMSKMIKTLKASIKENKSELKDIDLYDDGMELVEDDASEKKVAKWLEEVKDEDKSLYKSIKKDLSKFLDDEDEDDDDDKKKKKKGKKNKKNKKDKGDDGMKYLENLDIEDLATLVEEVLEKHEKGIKKISKKLVKQLESVQSDLEDEDEDAIPTAIGLLFIVSQNLEMKKSLKKQMIEMVSNEDSDDDEDEDEDDDDDKKKKKKKGKKNKKDKKDKKKGKTLDKVKDHLESLVEDNKDELKEDGLLKPVKALIEAIEEEEAEEKQAVKLYNKLVDSDELDAKKVLKKMADLLDIDEDDEDEDEDKKKKNKKKGKDKKKGKGKKDKKKGKKNKIDFDEIELSSKKEKAIKELIKDSDLGKKDKSKALDMLDDEEFEDLYELATDEDEDLADELKEIFRGCARVSSDEDSDDIDIYFIGGKNKYKVVRDLDDIESEFDSDDHIDITKETLAVGHEPAFEKVSKDIPIIVFGKIKSNMFRQKAKLMD